MKKLFLTVATISIFSMPALAQITAPDYLDPAKWVYKGGDAEVLSPADKNYGVWHEHYTPAVIPDESQDLLVIYKPVKIEVFIKDGKDKFAKISKEQPWLLIKVNTNALDDYSFHLFEYENGSWRYIKTLNQDKEMIEFLDKEYGLHP